MLRNIFLVTLFIYSVCAVHWEIREVDSEEDQLKEISAELTARQQFLNWCSICKSIMKRVARKISSRATPDEIKRQLYGTCDKIRIIKLDCRRFVDKYIKGLVEELVTDDGPNTICTKIHVCKRDTFIREFLLTNALTGGSDEGYDNL